jgi:hypothetical protein
MPDPRIPAPEPDQTIDEPEAEFDMEGRCEWCLSELPHDGLCRCPDSLKDLEAERAWLRAEDRKEL